MNTVTLKAAAPMAMHRRPTSVELADGKMEPLKGWAAKYNVEVKRWWGSLTIRPGAFTESLGTPSDIRILSQHDSWTPVGICESFDDSVEGLYVKSKVNTETQAGFELMSNVNAGVLAAFSVGFDILDSEIERIKEDGEEREREVIIRAQLKEISVVTFPAIEDAKIQQGDGPGRVRPNPRLTEDQMHPGARDALMRVLSA